MLEPIDRMKASARALRPFAAALALVAGPCGAARADVWTFDRQHTEVRFYWNHLGLARQSGEFGELRGELQFSPTDPERGRISVVIPVASLATGVKELDTHLRSGDFFDTARFPEITFASTAVRRTGEKTGEVDGELTIRGIARPLTLRVTWNFTGEHPLAAVNPVYQGKWAAGFSARTTLKRSEFGLGRGAPLVSDEVQIEIEAELLRKDG